MSDLIVSVDWSEVRKGKLDEVGQAVERLAAFVEEHEPRPLAYQAYLSLDGTRLTVFQVHPDSDSMEHHLVVAALVFAPFQDLLDLRAIDIYGRPSDALLQSLRAKADLLGGATVAVHELRAGFTRFL